MKYLHLLCWMTLFSACSSAEVNTTAAETPVLDTVSPIKIPDFCNEDMMVGAARTELYFDDIRGKKVGVVGNQSSMIGEKHLVDSLLAAEIQVVKVFSPEHGFRGTANAGEKVKDGIDEKTGIPIVSLYGKNKKPTKDQLQGIDVLLFDIQDVGARFYTYISTLHYVLEAAGECGVSVIILDRPNPNGHYVDGPILQLAQQSFVGMHQVPVVHGMTIGEYAKMIVGERWVKDSVDLKVVEMQGWDHTKFYKLPIAPSPNLKNMLSIYLYPSLCFFEGTVVSLGRGTDFPFQLVGHPSYHEDTSFSFVPTPNDGASSPKLMGERCYGIDLSSEDFKTIRESRRLDLSYLLAFYKDLSLGESFFLSNGFFNLLAGNTSLKAQIIAGKSEEEIRQSWEDDLIGFKKIRKKYILYHDFE